jgi:hypothetical protein
MDVEVLRMVWINPDGSTWRSEKGSVRDLNLLPNALGFKVANGGLTYAVQIKRVPGSDSWAGKWTGKTGEGRISATMYGNFNDGAIFSGEWNESGYAYWWIAELV